MVIKSIKLGPYKGIYQSSSTAQVEEAEIASVIDDIKRNHNNQNDKGVVEITDEFVQRLGIDDVSSVEEMTEMIHESLYQQKIDIFRAQTIQKIMEIIVEGSQLEIDDTVVEDNVDNMVKDIHQQLKEKDLDIDIYYLHNKLSGETSMRKKFRKEVIDAHTELAIMDEIAAVENMSIEDELYEEIKRNYMKLHHLEFFMDEDAFRETLKYKQVVDFLIEENRELS